MKHQTTQKAMRNYYGDNIYSVGYCDCWHLTRGIEATAYNSGVYGWNCDYYEINGVCICTGYRPHGISTHGITKGYEEAAKQVYNDISLTCNEKMLQIAAIRSNWIQALTENR